MLSRFRGVIVARTLVFVQAALLAAVHAGRAEDPCKTDLQPPDLAKPEPSPRRIVVRVSGDSLAPLIEKPIDEVFPVDDVILGVRATGEAHVAGQPQLMLADDPDSAAFVVHLTGTIQSRTVGRKGPVEIHSHSQTRFTAIKRVAYQPGRGFVGEPAQIEAQTDCQTDRIEPNRGKRLRRAIERRAWARVGQSRDQVNQIVQAKAEAKLREAFDRLLDSRLARLNRLADQRYAVATVLGSQGMPRYDCCTRHGCLMIAASSSESSHSESSHTGERAVDLITCGQKGPPVQIWVHEGVVGDRAAFFLRQVDLLRRTVGGATPVAQLPVAQLPENRARPAFDFATTGDWIVVHCGTQSSEVASLPADPERLTDAVAGR